MEQNTEPTLTEILTEKPPAWQCDKCERSFKTLPALRMHKVRAHGKGWDTSGNFARGKEEELRRKKREYQKQLRERYKREGRDSRGYLLKRGKGRGGPRSWTPERLKKFQATMEKRAREKRMAQAGAQMFEAGGTPPTKSKRIRYVYPEPQAEVTKTVTAIRFCPHCGTNIEKHL